MLNTDKSKTSLSGNVLQMKFMKRSALRIENEKSAEEQNQIIDDEHWVLDLPVPDKKKSPYVEESSVGILENLVYGRMSFQGFNQDVEKLMTANNQQIALDEAERKEKETSVSDREMANRFSSLVGTMSNKFAKKRNKDASSDCDKERTEVVNKKSRRQFKKPSDDS